MITETFSEGFHKSLLKVSAAANRKETSEGQTLALLLRPGAETVVAFEVTRALDDSSAALTSRACGFMNSCKYVSVDDRLHCC